MKVIFACVHNAGRSQMAAAFFNQMADLSRAIAISAGTNPADIIHDVVLETMKEVGIDLSNAKPQLLTDELASQAQMLVTMGCGEVCPSQSKLRQINWSLTDPKGKSPKEVASIRNEIKTKVAGLLHELNAMAQEI